MNRSVYLQAMEDTQALAEQYVHEAPCEIRVTSSISRGFYLLVSAKNRSYLSVGVGDHYSDSSFVELGKERGGQYAISTPDLLSLNRK